MEELFLKVNNKYDSNIQVYQCGWEACDPKHPYGPAVRDHYLIHFVVEGKGKYYIDDQVYEVGKNEGFLICPDDITYYEADELDPWHYKWVGFNGIKAAQYLKEIGLTREQPIIRTNNSAYLKDCLDHINESSKIVRGREVRMLGHLYLFLGALIEESENKNPMSHKEQYINKAIDYIEMHYHRNITVQSIAEYLGLNRSYFSSLFKNAMNLSPQKYLLHYRINKACELISNRADLNIGDIARSVGYTDPLVFSKTFKKLKGCSPSGYRMQSKE